MPEEEINTNDGTKKKSFLKRALKFILSVTITFIIYSIALIIIFKWMPFSTSSFIESEISESIENFFSTKLKRSDWVNYNRISDNLKLAVIASEDQKFKDHLGFDVEAIEDAIDEMQKGRRVRGASTITQQTSKNIFLWNSKNYIRKAIEVYYTVLIELLWSKERILEVYLNIAEFGKGIYGAGAASEKYFKTSPMNLTKFQCALLAAVLPSPKRYSADNPSAHVRKRQKRILHQMDLLGGTSFLMDL